MADRLRSLGRRLNSFHTVLMILMTLGYLLATHLSTINSLKAAIATKAERSELEMFDKKLTRIEVKLEEAIMTKGEFRRLHEHLDQAIMEMTRKGGSEQEGVLDNGK